MLLKDQRVFIVEDNFLNRTIFEFILKMQGAKIGFDLLGQDTLKKINEFKPNIIILDLMLPKGESGYDIFTKIRDNPAYSNVPIVAISATEASMAIPKAKQMGFSGFIAKPIDEARFAQQLVDLLDGQEIWSVGERYL